MNHQAVNPYLPSYEYIPDAEPYVFGERVYIYGSHDKFNGYFFCLNDYLCWSAPTDDLSDWRMEGTIYFKKQDPLNKKGRYPMYAPDVTRGIDGRYYLYYTIGIIGVMSVAVCDEPAGKYEFLGHVRFSNGHIWGAHSGEPFPFDPAVLTDDDDRVYLYSGFALKTPAIFSRMKCLKNPGGVVMELEQDMLTIKKGPELLFPRRKNNPPIDFLDHEFFEASSIHKINNKYYFIYSSWHNHELCYAISDHPMKNFSFGGTLVSIGDLYLDGNKDESKAKNYLGNTHGSIIKIKDRWYVFYHRQTNRHSFSRQACAESITMLDDGNFIQAEVTSCGLNNIPLKGIGKYQAYIACNLWSNSGTARYDILFPRIRLRNHPYFTQTGKDGDESSIQCIANMRHGSVAGFKYFDFNSTNNIRIEIDGKCEGEMVISNKSDFKYIGAKISINIKNSFLNISSDLNLPSGKQALFFKFLGKGKLNFYSFELY